MREPRIWNETFGCDTSKVRVLNDCIRIFNTSIFDNFNCATEMACGNPTLLLIEPRPKKWKQMTFQNDWLLEKKHRVSACSNARCWKNWATMPLVGFSAACEARFSTYHENHVSQSMKHKKMLHFVHGLGSLISLVSSCYHPWSKTFHSKKYDITSSWES